MTIIRIEKQKEVHVLGAQKPLSNTEIDAIAKKQVIQNFEFEEYEHYQCKGRQRIFKGFDYVLKWKK